MGSAELLEKLREHYIKPGHTRTGDVFLTEVTAPGSSGRRADVVHVGLWPSRGQTVTVHELKVSRADFMRELDDPGKAQAWWPHSSSYWIVAPDLGVAPAELLPPGWGLMVPGTRGRRFKTVVQAEFRDLKPSVALMAVLLTSQQTDHANALEQLRYQHRQETYTQLDKVRREAAALTDPATRGRLTLLGQLEEGIGMRLDKYDWGEEVSVERLAAAIRRAVLEDRACGEIEDLLARIDTQADGIKKQAAQLREDLCAVAASSGGRA